nr:molybdenum cofactor biosynthesis protein MoaE [uncultured Lichenicoccus sp.]
MTRDPVSLRVAVQAGPFDAGAEIAALSASGAGAVASFIGLVRGDVVPGRGSLQALRLEHYPGMTERAVARVVEAAAERFDLLGCTVIHRIGRLEIGAPIVLVLAAARHRRAALEATGYLIDWLKTGAPFWKQELFSDGSNAWVEAREADDLAAARWDAV